jgi:hypothetical protein
MLNVKGFDNFSDQHTFDTIRMHHSTFLLAYVLLSLLQPIIASDMLTKTKTLMPKPVPAVNTKTIKMPLWTPRYTKFNTKTIPYPPDHTKAAHAVRSQESSWNLIPAEAIPNFNEQAKLQNGKTLSMQFTYKCESNLASPFVEDIESCARKLLDKDSCPLLDPNGSKCTSLANQKTSVLLSCSKCLTRAQEVRKVAKWLRFCRSCDALLGGFMVCSVFCRRL